MYTYVCCRCKSCSAQIVLEDRGSSDTNSLHRPPRPRAGREACPIGEPFSFPQTITSRKVGRLSCSGPSRKQIHGFAAATNRKASSIVLRLPFEPSVLLSILEN